jgi:hypothetical protein
MSSGQNLCLGRLLFCLSRDIETSEASELLDRNLTVRRGEPGGCFILNHRFQRMRKKVWDYELLLQLCFEYLMLYGSPASQMTNTFRLMDDDLVRLRAVECVGSSFCGCCTD